MSTVFKNKSIVFILLLVLGACQKPGKSVDAATEVQEETYTNPILPVGNKPWAIYQNGYYYYTQETGRSVEIWKTKDLTDLRNAPHKAVCTPTDSNSSFALWPPEHQ